MNRARDLTILFSSMMTVMAGATIAPALPEMAKVFADVPRADLLIPLVLTLPALSIAIGAPFAGTIVDRFGRRWVLIGALMAYALTGIAGLFVRNLSELLISRAVLGFAVAAIMTTCTTLIGDFYQGAELRRMFGLQGSFMAGSGVLFLPLGGMLATFGWRYPFVVYGLSLFVVPFAIKHVTEPPRLQTVAAGTGRIAWPWRVYATGACSMALFYLMPVTLPFLLKELGATSPSTAGMALAVMTLCSSLVAANYERVRRFLPRSPLGFAFTMLAIGFALVGGAGLRATPLALPLIVLGLAAVGSGLGLVMPSMAAWLMHNLPAFARGRGSGRMTSAYFLGQFASPLLFAALPSGLPLAWHYLTAGIASLALTSPFWLRPPLALGPESVGASAIGERQPAD